LRGSFYFQHDYNARRDGKIANMIRTHGLLGYGLYWALVEDLYEAGGRIDRDYDRLAYDLRVDKAMVQSVIEDFDLFYSEDGGKQFGSRSIDRRLQERREKIRQAQEAGRLGGLKRSDQATAKRPLSDRLTTAKLGEERKGEERKEITDRGLGFPWPPGFLSFWDLYPKKLNQHAAAEAWNLLAPQEPLLSIIMAAVVAQSAHWRDHKTPFEYIPGPARWLNEHRWTDVLDIQLPSTPKPPQCPRCRISGPDARPTARLRDGSPACQRCADEEAVLSGD